MSLKTIAFFYSLVREVEVPGKNHALRFMSIILTEVTSTVDLCSKTSRTVCQTSGGFSLNKMTDVVNWLARI